MIVYFDSSAILRLYLDEARSDRIRGIAANASACCSHLIAYAEARAGLAAAVRMTRIDEKVATRLLADFEEDWRNFDVIGVDEQLVRRAGRLAAQFSLRAYDSLHLAAVERLAIEVGGSMLEFACFDAALSDAAAQLGVRGISV